MTLAVEFVTVNLGVCLSEQQNIRGDRLCTQFASTSLRLQIVQCPAEKPDFFKLPHVRYVAR
jgi:hypothetical protein